MYSILSKVMRMFEKVKPFGTSKRILRDAYHCACLLTYKTVTISPEFYEGTKEKQNTLRTIKLSHFPSISNTYS